MVSIHAPTRGATACDTMSSSMIEVSIHAPTRGATYSCMVCFVLHEVSIHAPTRGATLSNSKFFRIIEFQSTHPRGVRPSNRIAVLCHILVSIHAPTRGATLMNIWNTDYAKFQSTHPRGVRRYDLLEEHLEQLFQSTHPRGVRHDYLGACTDIYSFNPRTHEGCDWTPGSLFENLKFQSTHPRGVRPKP